MTSRARTFLKYLFSALLTVLFLYLAFRQTDFEKLLVSMKNANYWWFLLFFALLMISHVLRSWRWRYLLEPIKPNIALNSLFSGVMVGYLVNNLLPRAGEIVRPYAIGKLESIPKSAALGTIVVERIMDTVSFLILVALMPLLYDGPLRDTFPWLERTGVIVSSITFAIVFSFVTLMIRRDLTDRLLRSMGKFLPQKLSLRVDKIAHSFLDGFLFLKRPDNFFIIVVLSIGVWVMYILMMYTAFYAFDLHLGFRAAIVLQALVSIGFAMPTPGATGSYHVFASQTLSGLFFVPNEIALSYATLTHAVGFIGVTVVGLFFFLKDHLRVSEAVGKVAEFRNENP